MPPYNSVKCLQSLAMEQICKYVLDITPEMKKNQDESRVYFLNNVHPWARTDILARTKVLLDNGKKDCEIRDELNRMYDSNSYLEKLKSKLSSWLVILDAMLDISVYQLPPIIVHGERELNELVTILSRSNCHLRTLNVTFLMSFKNDCTPTMSNSLKSIERSLHEGLASRLVFLKLVAICDNSILKTIGEHALCLKHLDVSSSWSIDESGIKHLLFKNNVHVETNNEPSGKLCQRLSQLYDDKSSLNPCCFTLEELRIQNTNTENAALLMILACVKSLKALGDFPYIRNIGDALVTVWENSPKPRTFQLIELYDMQLTVKKIYAFQKCLPHLKKLYTQLCCVPQDSAVPHHGLMFWHCVKKLTISLNHMLNFHFHNFLNDYGENLSELVILEQKAYLDVDKILTCCPNLILLKGFLQIAETLIRQYPTLKALELHMPNEETISWFFVNCPGIEEAKVVCDSRQLYWNALVFQNPPLIMCNNLKRFEFCFKDNCPFTNSQLVIDFINKCSKLQHLGRIDKWNMDKRFVNQIKNYVKKMNYELNIY